MNAEQLRHLPRAAASVTGENEFVVIGSQAILGSHPDAPRSLRKSVEGDTYPKNTKKSNRNSYVTGPLQPQRHRLDPRCHLFDLFRGGCGAVNFLAQHSNPALRSLPLPFSFSDFQHLFQSSPSLSSSSFQLFSFSAFSSNFTGRENIFLNGAILGLRKAEIKAKFDEIVDFSGCDRYIDSSASSCCGR